MATMAPPMAGFPDEFDDHQSKALATIAPQGMALAA